mgnify:CR=1 FL=1|jgi:hypothetical protein
MAYYTVAFTPSATSSQQELLRLIRQFNQDENLWQSLEGRRQFRRKLFRLTREQHNALDLAEYAHAKPPEDCIARQLSHQT